MPDATPTNLSRLILEQTRQEVGVPVLLFTTATLAPPSPPAVDVASRAAIARVGELAAQLDLDLDDLPLSSAGAYLLQSALGASTVQERE